MAISATFNPATGLLFVTGDNLGDHIEISRAPNDTILINGGAIAIQGGVATVSKISEISVLDGNGSSLIRLDESIGTLPAAHLVGLGGDDILIGGTGHDLLEGGAGADQLFGGGGTDTASYNGSGAGVVIDLTNGTARGGDAQGDLLDGIENLTGSGFADTLFGNGLDNVLRGGDGDDNLNGSDGNDTLIGGRGGDFLIGGAGTDTASYADSFAGVTVQIGGGGIGGDAQGDTLDGIENLIGSTFADRLIGDERDNFFTGGLGADVLIGNAGIDTASYADSATGVQIDLFTGTGLGGTAEGDSLSGIENVTGSAFGDALFADDGDNVLNGLDGNDLLSGHGGNDTLDGGDGIDAAAFSGVRRDYRVSQLANGDLQVVDLRAVGSRGGPPDGTDTLRSVEKLAFTDVTVDASAAVFTPALPQDDLNSDGRSDILWRNIDGTLADWSMNGSAITSSGLAAKPDASWSIAGISDFNGDLHADVLWRNTDGTLVDWSMNGSTITSSGVLTAGGVAAKPDASWSVAGIGDFDGDGRADVLWRNTDGTLVDWAMNGSTIQTSRELTSGGTAARPDASWSVAGIGDFNGDGLKDVLWRNANGTLVDWAMNSWTITSSGVLKAGGVAARPDSSWSVAGVGDFNSDGNADILWRNNNGSLVEWLMNGSTITSSGSITSGGANVAPDASWHLVEIGDFNGDRSSDVLWRNDNGAVAEWLMNGTTIGQSLTPASNGAPVSPDGTWSTQARPTNFG